MSSDKTYGPKVRLVDGGDTLDLAPGAKLTVDGAQLSLTSVVTTATTQSTPFGFATQAQGDNVVAQLNLLIAWAKAMGASL